MTPLSLFEVKCMCECSVYLNDTTTSGNLSDNKNSASQHPSDRQGTFSISGSDSGMPRLPLVHPSCHGITEPPGAHQIRAQVSTVLQRRLRADISTPIDANFERSAVFTHFTHGLAYTAGSATGCSLPSIETCFAAYIVPNRTGLTTGARAWSKHAHRTQFGSADAGWWGRAQGPVSTINEGAIALFWKIMDGTTWRNLHWLPHQVLVYEVRVLEGYGMRWSQDQSNGEDKGRQWMFRGFLEPTMENGHELGWRHPVNTDANIK